MAEYEELEEKGCIIRWHPADEPPPNDRYILLSYENFPMVNVGRYEGEYKYMVRERNGNLWIYKCVQTKRIIGLGCEELLDYVYIGDMKVDFPMVKWEDKEPWLIEDLKKLEVEE